MKTIERPGIGTWARLLPVVLFAACATAPPAELVSARTGYAKLVASPEGKAAPVEMHKAKVALDLAEQSFASDDQPETRDLAYVAERKVQTAEAAGSIALAEAETLAAEAALERQQTKQLAGVKSDLNDAQSQLAESGRVRTAMAEDLSTERSARAEAESAATAAQQSATTANEALAKLAAKEDQRGTVITLSGSVVFASGQAVLLPRAQMRLDEVATALMEAKDRRILIEGHTDSTGAANANLALSQRRADAVRSYLVSRGYPSEKIEARGIGQERPVAENRTAEGRSNNRRVEIVVQRATHSSLP